MFSHKGSFHRFVFCEGIYVVLSLTSKVWLGALVLANVTDEDLEFNRLNTTLCVACD